MNIPAGDVATNEINVITEIQRGMHNKYEFDKDLNMMVLDRVTAVPMSYPADYGWVPNTLCEDGDPLDALIVIDEPLTQGVLVKCRAIGVLNMIDDGERDEKLICVAVDDLTKQHIQDIDDLGPDFKKYIEHYYTHYKDWKKDWQGSSVSFDGWGDKATALKVFEQSIQS